MLHKSIWLITGGIGLAFIFSLMSADLIDKPGKATQQSTDNSSYKINKLRQELNNLRAQVQSSTVSTDKNKFIQDGYSQASQTITEMQEQINLLKKSVQQIEQKTPGEVNSVQSIDNQQLTQWELERQYEQRQQQQASLYIEQIQQEVTDPGWSAGTEQKTIASLSQVSDKLGVDNITCKSSMCQLDITRASNSSDEEALDAFETSISWDGEMALQYDPETGKGTVYMARPGYDLPILNNGS